MAVIYLPHLLHRVVVKIQGSVREGSLKHESLIQNAKHYLWHSDWGWSNLNLVPCLLHLLFLLRPFVDVKINNEFMWFTRNRKNGGWVL